MKTGSGIELQSRRVGVSYWWQSLVTNYCWQYYCEDGMRMPILLRQMAVDVVVASSLLHSKTT